MIGRTLAHYTIEGRLGGGGMGDVYLARDTQLGRKVAIKVIHPDDADDPALAGRLLREARTASALNHPNIVTVYEVGRAGDVDFIAMEHIEGRPLSSLITPDGLPVTQVIDYAAQIAGAVAAAHGAGIVHRDLKPGNVMVLPGGRIKVLDFGLAKRSPPPRVGGSGGTSQAPTVAGTRTGMLLGTVGYMAPEQIQGHAADARSDVFSIGVMLFEMLAGRPPFEGASPWEVMAATMNAGAPSITSRRPETPPALSAIVSRCLAPRPGDRYASAAELARDLAALAAREPAAETGRTRAFMVGGLALAVLALGLIVFLLMRESQMRWARDTAVAEMTRLGARDDIVGAYRIGQRAIEIAPKDSYVRQAWSNLTQEKTISSEPPGAEVAFTGFTNDPGGWVSLGQTPIMGARIPVALLRWRVTKAGYDTLDVGQGIGLLEFKLTRAGTAPAGMTRVPPGSFQLESTNEEVLLPDFWLDRCEVTNRQFKAFVDAGGYRTRTYWTQPFLKGGRTLSWEEAVATFRDATGRPGPSTWELGAFPEGQDDVPVGGVSWYEAAAYAAFAGKQIPTIYHWSRASGAFSVFSDILSTSNFSGKGPVKVGGGGLGPYGTYDMAGNVKEWCWNATGDGRRYILGGGWNEATYMFRDEDARTPFDREATFGFRCMRQDSAIAPRLLADVRSLERDPRTLKPVGDDVYRAYLHLYDYDPLPLDARVESVDDASPAWRKERVTVRAAYGDERLPLLVYIPKSASPPYQAVVYFPGSNAVLQRSSQNVWLQMADFYIRSGRVLVYPIYQGTYERHLEYRGNMSLLRDVMIQRGKDLRRAVDYLATRKDIDATRIAFAGLSLGAQLGPLLVGIEPRFRTGVFFSGGFETWDMPPEADPVNFAPRVRMPILMVNGREDFDLPYATAQLPMFRMLGTPAADKRLAMFEGGHIPPHPQEAMKVILDWLDERMGPVH